MTPRRSRRGRRLATPAAAPGPPEEFRARMAALLGPEAEAFFRALRSPAAGLRVNTLRLTPERFRDISPFELAPLPFPPEGFSVADASRPGAHPYHAAGLYYLQDPGAMVVGALPELPPAARVLDLAAAPGGKATHLAARLGGRGVLVANDVNVGRARELSGNLERCGVRNAVVTAEVPRRLAERWEQWFDLVLVDAPCSGESMFHKSEAARREWSPAAVLGCARRQRELLDEAVRLVRPGGMLIYSTCTFAPEENEAVVAALLNSHPELAIEPLTTIAGASAARPEWAGEDGGESIAGALRLWPHHFPGAGHFVAALRRASPGGAAPQDGTAGERVRVPRPDDEGLRLMREFFAHYLPTLALEGELVLEGEGIHLRPAGAPPLEGLRVVRDGWWLGSARKGRFEPSHSLAMAVPPAECEESVSLPAGSAEVAAYLRGETLRLPGPDGWVLVMVDGFALGWGKRSVGVVKNHYPRGLRRH